MTDWQTHFQTAQHNLVVLGEQFIELGAQLDALVQLRDAATAQVITLGRTQGIELNSAAISASIEMPYILFRVDEKTWKMIMWRGRQLPIIGQFDFQTEGFTVSTVTPSSRLFSHIVTGFVDIYRQCQLTSFRTG